MFTLYNVFQHALVDTIRLSNRLLGSFVNPESNPNPPVRNIFNY